MPEKGNVSGGFAGKTKQGFRRVCAGAAANLRAARAESPSRAFHAEAVAYVYAFNVIFMTLLTGSYLSTVPEETSVAGWLVTIVASVSNSTMLALVPMMLAAPAAILARRWWVTLIIIPCVYAVANGFLYADTIIYRLFRMHFNAVVVNVLMTPGADDSVTAGTGTWITSVTIVAAMFAAQLAFALFGYTYLRRRAFASRLRTGKALAVAAAVLVGLFLTDKTLFAVGDLRDDIESTRAKYLFPLYQPVTVRAFARDVLGMDISRHNLLRLAAQKGSMDYPKSPVTFRPDGARPNVLVVVIEGGRFDALDPEVMPFLRAWGQKNLVFEEHYSGGNCSRFGVFALLYGIHGTYWHRVLAERRGSTLVETLAALGYEFSILSCTSLEFPEFRKTAFIDIPELITDSWDCERLDRDRVMTDAFLDFLDGREDAQPFFAFMFYDASHQPYLYPPEHAVFETDAEPADLDYVKVARDLSLAMPFRERFRNSLHYVDSQIERAVRRLAERGLLSDTLVFVTGDHGEEFCELGLFGHNSTFHRYQAKTVMVAHIPNEKPRRVKRLTSHVDIVPTIFTYMGVRNPLEDYTQGSPLTAAEGPEYILVSGWDDAAVVDARAITHFGLEVYNADMTVMDHDYRALADQRGERARRADWFVEVLEGMRRFVK